MSQVAPALRAPLRRRANVVPAPRAKSRSRLPRLPSSPPPPHVHLGFNLPLVVDGIVGNNTWGRLDPPQIQKNSPQHNYVRLCQLILKSFAVPAFDPGPADGIFGPNTEAAVKAFQAIFATPADGIVGPKTWRALRS